MTSPEEYLVPGGPQLVAPHWQPRVTPPTTTGSHNGTLIQIRHNTCLRTHLHASQNNINTYKHRAMWAYVCRITMIIGLQHIRACTETRNSECAHRCRLNEQKHQMKHNLQTFILRKQAREETNTGLCCLFTEPWRTQKKLKKLLSKMQSKMAKNRLWEAELKSWYWSTFIRKKWHKWH